MAVFEQRPGTAPATAAAAASLVEVAVDTADGMMREHGLATPPTTWLLLDNLPESPLAGFIKSRMFYKGDDAARAIARMGTLPAAMMADRIVVTWEQTDLCSALKLPLPDGEAQVVLDATLDDHWVHHCPMNTHIGPVGVLGIPTLIPTWGPRRVEHNPDDLPDPIAELLELFRVGTIDNNVAEVNETLQLEGYAVSWTEQVRPRR